MNQFHAEDPCVRRYVVLDHEYNKLAVCAYEISKSDEYTNHVILSIREYTALYTETAR